MKISDEELIKLIFIQILNQLPESITHNYTESRKGLVRDDQCWKDNALSLHICERKKITNKITRPHLLNRIKNLFSKEKIVSTFSTGKSYPLTFTLNDKRLLDAFYFSLKFWNDHGLDEKPVKFDKFESLCDELRALLLEKFAGVKS